MDIWGSLYQPDGTRSWILLRAWFSAKDKASSASKNFHGILLRQQDPKDRASPPHHVQHDGEDAEVSEGCRLTNV